ncbi:uncharacterized protein LOC143037976 [Oratosquilla oratoria]|uniref:uncharacterized protein LOC143037976 n=1 Tax=Oratosquilla oratoria TaxID=337810 RepID=UPI003F75AFB6
MGNQRTGTVSILRFLLVSLLLAATTWRCNAIMATSNGDGLVKRNTWWSKKSVVETTPVYQCIPVVQSLECLLGSCVDRYGDCIHHATTTSRSTSSVLARCRLHYVSCILNCFTKTAPSLAGVVADLV